jgi:hypothetical protein
MVRAMHVMLHAQDAKRQERLPILRYTAWRSPIVSRGSPAVLTALP